MSKPIKVDDQVYDDLDKLRVKSVTFSQVIEQLLKDRLAVFEHLTILEGQVNFQVWRAERQKELESADAVRRDVEARTIT